MNVPPRKDKPAVTGTPAPADPPPSSGEGADTALHALIRKRRLRGEEVPPPATEPPTAGPTPSSN